jgi:hypothetical protein
MRKLLQPVVLELTAEIIGAAGPRVSEQASGRNEGRQRELDNHEHSLDHSNRLCRRRSC